MSHFLKIKMYNMLCQKHNKLAYFEILYQINKIPLVNIWKAGKFVKFAKFTNQFTIYKSSDKINYTL